MQMPSYKNIVHCTYCQRKVDLQFRQSCDFTESCSGAWGAVCLWWTRTWIAATFEGIVAVGHRRGTASRRRGCVTACERQRGEKMKLKKALKTVIMKEKTACKYYSVQINNGTIKKI